MANAPRFHAFWEQIEGRSVLTMPRSDWDAVVARFGAPVQLDISRTPLAQVAKDAAVIAAVAEQLSTAIARVSIFRGDPQDAPTPINQDKYTVWLDLQSHPRLMEMVTRGSTEDNANFRQFIGDNVFLVKQDHGNDHWLPSLPASVSAIIRST